MDRIDSLSAQQRAVLQLLLRQGRSYDEIAGLLHADTAAIRRRAQAAVAALAADDANVSVDRRNEVADYLLGQQTASQRAATREYLEGSAPGRGWARTAAGALAPVGGAAQLPDVPAEREEVAEAFDALEARTARQEEVQRAAKRGNALISAGLGLVVAIVIIVVVALASSGGGDKPSTGQAATTTPARTSTTGTSTTGTSTVAGDARVVLQSTLRPPAGTGGNSSGEAAIVVFPQSRRFRLALAARNLPPSSARGSAYGVWLYSSAKDKVFLGFPSKVVGSDGVLQVVTDLSPDTPGYRRVLLTRESTQSPKSPGTIVLDGRLQRAPAGQSTTPAPTTP
jgi:hypothetical protein